MWAAWLLVCVGSLLVPGVPGAGMGWMTVSPSGKAVPMQDQVTRWTYAASKMKGLSNVNIKTSDIQKEILRIRITIASDK